jgi:hypothetical protein
LLNSAPFWTVLSLPLALIFQAILADKDVLDSALVVQLAFAQMFAMTTTNAQLMDVSLAKEETDAHLLPKFALTATSAQPTLAILLLLEDVCSPTSPAMTTTHAQMTTASEPLVARVWQRSATTTILAHPILAIPPPTPEDAFSLSFPPALAMPAEMLSARPFLAALLDASMELALPLQSLAMTTTPALRTPAILSLDLANTLQSTAMTTTFALTISAILKLAASIL